MTLNQLRSNHPDLISEEQIFDKIRVRLGLVIKQRVEIDDVEDIVQDTCLTIIEKIKSGVRPDNFEAWALEIARMKVGNFYQKRETRRRIVSIQKEGVEPRQVDLSNIDSPLQSEVRECFRKLLIGYPRYARVLNLIYQGYKTDEVAERLGIRVDNLYVILNRGRKLLQDCLNNG